MLSSIVFFVYAQEVVIGWFFIDEIASPQKARFAMTGWTGLIHFLWVSPSKTGERYFF